MAENDQTLPLAQNPETPVVPDPANPQGQTPPVSTDVDDIEVLEALAAAEAEKAAGAQTGAGGATTGTTPAQAQPQGQNQPAPSGDAPVMIPKGRFDEVNTRAQTAEQRASEAERTAAYWKGIADARAAPAPASGAVAAPAPQATPEQRLAQIDTAVDALAKKFDDGEITMADMKAQERVLQAQASAIRQEAAPRPQQQPAAPQQNGNELYLETLTAQLEENHPWVGVLDKVGTKADWDYVTAQAVERVTAAGKDPRNGALGQYELRKAAAEIADEIGPGLLTKRAQAKGVAIPGQASPQPQPQPGPAVLSPEAQARQAKLTLAQGHPPNVNAMQGAGGPGTGAIPSEAAIEAMSDEDIGKLPDAVRNKLLGRVA